MRIGVFVSNNPNRQINTIVNTLKFADVQTVSVEDMPPHLDCIVVPGGDRGVRKYFRNTNVPPVPVLGIHKSEEGGGFLAQISTKDLRMHAKRLERSEYTVEEIPRLGVKVDENQTYPVLNDAAIFSAKSAILMEHTLRVNGQEIWHDSSDGIIVSTPMGSTAYSMSAGGPMIFQGAQVFGIVSVNSLDVTRRPLIVPSDSLIEIDNMSARIHCEVVLDGTDRIGVKKSVTYAAYSPPAQVIRMNQDSTSVAALAKKVYLAEDLLSMPPSSKLLLKTLEYEGSMTQRELAIQTLLPNRTVRMALTRLVKRGYVKRKTSVRDARSKIYEISNAMSSSSDKGTI